MATQLILNESDLQLTLMKLCSVSGSKLFEGRRGGPVLTSVAYDNLDRLTDILVNTVDKGLPEGSDELVLFSVALRQFREFVSNSRSKDHTCTNWADEVESADTDVQLPAVTTSGNEVSSSPTGKKAKAKGNRSKSKSRAKPAATVSAKQNSTSKTKKKTEMSKEAKQAETKPVVLPRTFKQVITNEFGRTRWVGKLFDVYAEKIKVCHLDVVATSADAPVLTGNCLLPDHDLHSSELCQVCRDNIGRGTSVIANRVDMLHIALAHLKKFGITDAQIDTTMKMLHEFRETRQSKRNQNDIAMKSLEPTSH